MTLDGIGRLTVGVVGENAVWRAVSWQETTTAWVLVGGLVFAAGLLILFVGGDLRLGGVAPMFTGGPALGAHASGAIGPASAGNISAPQWVGGGWQ